MQNSGPRQKIYTVSELTSDIKSLLENRYPMLWIAGEISNFRKPGSGHFYFTLKDATSQISAVMFGGQARSLRFSPRDGLQVTGLGRISVYEPRGAYQFIFEYIEPKGVGALVVAFEQLKTRLAAEGLFREDRKKKIPFLPRKICVITSRTGAVIHDIIQVARRRFPDIHLIVVPVKVQGEGSEEDIAAAIRFVNTQKGIDVILLARGGGSIEDLHAFNSETVARAIFHSEIPVISGVGHETDVTIADFAADLRAPTPSAAAELAVPKKRDLSAAVTELRLSAKRLLFGILDAKRRELTRMSKRLRHPGQRIDDARLRIDELTERLSRQARRLVSDRRHRLLWRTDQLNALDPESVLDRGYCIAFSLPEKKILRDARDTDIGQSLHVKLAKGYLDCRVERISANGDPTDL